MDLEGRLATEMKLKLCIWLTHVMVLGLTFPLVTRVSAEDTILVTLKETIPTACRLHVRAAAKGVVVAMEKPHGIYDSTNGDLLGNASRVSKEVWRNTSRSGASQQSYFLYMSRSDESVHVIDVDRKQEFEVELKNLLIEDFAVSPDGHWLAVTRKDVHLFNLPTMEPAGTLARPKVDCNATSVAFSPDSKHLIVTNGGVPGHKEHGGFPRSITRWRMDGFVGEQTVECDFVPLETAVLPDGKTFIANGSVMGLERFDVYTLRRLEPVKFDFAPRGFDFSPDGKCLLIRAEKAGKGMMIVDTTTWDVLV
jgi:WD40 repeat protein